MNRLNIVKQQFISILILFFSGGIIYYFLEIMFRGYSHFSMFIAGGLSIVAIDITCRKSKFLKRKSIFVKATFGGLIITFVEFIMGIICNIALRMSIWDYSQVPFNILGQICIPFTFIWILLSFPALLICKVTELIINNIKFLKNNKIE